MKGAKSAKKAIFPDYTLYFHVKNEFFFIGFSVVVSLKIYVEYQLENINKSFIISSKFPIEAEYGVVEYELGILLLFMSLLSLNNSLCF